MPSTQDQGRIRAQKPKLQFRKIQLPHRSFVGIGLLVSRPDAIPAACHSATPGKRQLWRMPISHQKCVHVPTVPRGLLRVENGPDRLSLGIMLISGLGEHSILQQRKYPQCQRPYQRPIVIRSHVRSPCKSLYTGRIGEGLPCKQAFSLRPPCKPNDYSELHLIVLVHWYFRTIGVYFPWRDTSFRG